jgi:FkbM family methyltransferase
MAQELESFPKWYSFDGRLPNFRLHRIDVAQCDSQSSPVTVRRIDGSISSFDYEGNQFSFFVDRREDTVQCVHASGRFYEVNELESLREMLPLGARILDVGAHVGNHTIYFDKLMRASRVVPVEPATQAGFLLRTNCALNSVQNVDLAFVGQALGSRNTQASLVVHDLADSAGAQLRLEDGPIPVRVGDELFSHETFDLIKIDVEGMELDVLQGLEACIRRSRPILCVDVAQDLLEPFLELMASWNYQVRRQLGSNHIATFRSVTGFQAPQLPRPREVAVTPVQRVLGGIRRQLLRSTVREMQARHLKFSGLLSRTSAAAGRAAHAQGVG